VKLTVEAAKLQKRLMQRSFTLSHQVAYPELYGWTFGRVPIPLSLDERRQGGQSKFSLTLVLRRGIDKCGILGKLL
jgi:hypothetical protein